MSHKPEEYIRFWTVCLKKLLGWSEEQISEWTTQFARDLNDLESDFVRQDPIAYVIPVIVPAELQKQLPRGHLARLYEKIRFAITGDPRWLMMKDLPDEQMPPVEWWKRLEHTAFLGEHRGEILTSSNLDYYDWDAARKRVKTVLQGEVVSLDGNPTKEQEYYIKHWKVVLSKLLGWSDDKVLEWAKQFEAEVGDVNSLFYHQGPIYYLVPLFVPRRAYDSLSPRDLRKLQEELEFAIMRNPKTIKFEDLSNGERPSEDPFRFVKIIRSAQQKGELLAPVNFDYYDWEAAKERIRTVLRHNGLADDLGI